MKLACRLCLAFGLLSGCGSTVQTTSGADYAERYAAPLDGAIRQAAAVEPILTLPARFGLARIVNGRLTAIPESEAALWREAARRQQNLGEFVPVSPLVAEFTASALQRDCGAEKHCDPRSVVETIRLGAARQHVDAVLIYEVGLKSARGNTPLAVADLTLIGGAFLPTRRIEAEGRAAALLLDVRNGYPYGTASASADLSKFSTSWGSVRRLKGLEDEAVATTVGRLVPEVETMFEDLRKEMFRRSRAGT